MTTTCETPAPAVPRARRPRGWAAKFGDWATQYDAPGGAVVTLMRYAHSADAAAEGEIGVWECSCGQRGDQRPFPPYADARAAAEAHAAACTKPARCRRCGGTGLAHPR